MLKVQEIRELIRLVDQSSINEFTYETNEATITLKKGADQPQVVQTPVIEKPVTAPAAPAPQAKQPPAIEQEKEEVKPEPEQTEEKTVTDAADYDHEITSPMVGTFYQASSPESDPYVEVGSKVSNDTIVCIVEAMKLFNEIEAEVKGEIVEILVEDGELVEYGQPLFRVKK